MAKDLEHRAEVPQTFEMGTMLAMGSMQSALEGQESHLGYCKARGLEKWGRKCHTDVLLAIKPGGPRWKDV
eukprot:7760434-Lingulodinium_polyedra.AAC.1